VSLPDRHSSWKLTSHIDVKAEYGTADQ
jgi:hypothetical protein